MASPLLFLSTDARILDRIRKGDEEALVELYRANRKAITALVMRNSGTPDDADDMLQEALVTLWERVRGGSFTQTANLGTFLYATAKNLWLRRLARKRREVAGSWEGGDPPADDPSALDLLVDAEESAVIARALERVGEPCRELLLLFYWEGCTMEEIAVRMGFANADTAKSKKYQCKKAMERMLRGALANYD